MVKIIEYGQKAPKTYIEISLEKNTVVINEDINITITVKDESDNIVSSVNGTYYIPIIRASDSIQARLLKLDVINGEGQVTFNISSPDIYTININQIYPKPISQLVQVPMLIVEENEI